MDEMDEMPTPSSSDIKEFADDVRSHIEQHKRVEDEHIGMLEFLEYKAPKFRALALRLICTNETLNLLIETGANFNESDGSAKASANCLSLLASMCTLFAKRICRGARSRRLVDASTRMFVWAMTVNRSRILARNASILLDWFVMLRSYKIFDQLIESRTITLVIRCSHPSSAGSVDPMEPAMHLLSSILEPVMSIIHRHKNAFLGRDGGRHEQKDDDADAMQMVSATKLMIDHLSGAGNVTSDIVQVMVIYANQLRPCDPSAQWFLCATVLLQLLLLGAPARSAGSSSSIDVDQAKVCSTYIMRQLEADARFRHNMNLRGSMLWLVEALERWPTPYVSKKNRLQTLCMLVECMGDRLGKAAIYMKATEKASVNDICAWCGHEAGNEPSSVGADTKKMKTCARCRSVKYCMPECQKKHWKNGHKLACKN